MVTELDQPTGKRPLRKSRHRWVGNIKMNLRKREWDGIDWINLAQERDKWRAPVNTEINIWVPKNIGKFLSI
jgi:hypothetical protein